jgi:hypothetical protein
MKERKYLLNTVGAAVIMGFAACGGGGGGDEPAPPVVTVINITTANRDSVGHAAVAAVLALSPTGATIPLATSSPASARLPPALLQPLNKWVSGAWARREQPQTVHGPYDYYAEMCPGGGRVREWDDDRDENLDPSVGDVMTLVFEGCKDNVGGTANGTMTMTLTQISPAPVPSGSAQVTLSQMSVVTANHSMALDGSMLFYYALPTNTSLETARMTASGPVTVTVSTHVGYSDTLTLQSGFVEEDRYDAALGRTLSTVNGRLQSAVAGGAVDVTTVASAPMTTYDTDAYPRAGVVQVRGRNSMLQITALSANDVRLDLDADGNGSFESGSMVSWDWLL